MTTQGSSGTDSPLGHLPPMAFDVDVDLSASGAAAATGAVGRRPAGETVCWPPEVSGPDRARSMQNARRGIVPLRAAHTKAILMPPLVTYAVALLFVGLVQGTLGVAPLTWEWGRVIVLCAIVVPVVGIGSIFARALPVAWYTGWPEAVISLSAALIADATLPPPMAPTLVVALVVLLGAGVPVLSSLWRESWLRHHRTEATLLAANERDARVAGERLRRVPGLEIVSAIVPDGNPQLAARWLQVPATSIVTSRIPVARRIIVSAPSRNPLVASAIARLVARGHDIASESATLRASEGRVDSTKSDPLNVLMSCPRSAWRDGVSRCIDVVAAGATLLLIAPLLVIVAALVKLDSPGPVFFRQMRVGYRGRPFKIVKFRTMRHRAEAETGPVWAQKDDPRITRVGRVLRRSRIDELPQLFNVLVGEMALVGPRPERRYFFRQLRSELPVFELRTAVRPGITGWAQVCAAYASDKEEARTKLDYDLFYLTRRSVWFDLAILFETVGVALSGKGAR